jgi:hypothetical protein
VVCLLHLIYFIASHRIVVVAVVVIILIVLQHGNTGLSALHIPTGPASSSSLSLSSLPPELQAPTTEYAAHQASLFDTVLFFFFFFHNIKKPSGSLSFFLVGVIFFFSKEKKKRKEGEKKKEAP